MFENMYRYARVMARHLDGPAAEERDRFVAHFAASGATRDSVSNLASALLVVARRLDISGTSAVTPEEVASVADRWVQYHRRRGRSISPGRRQRFVQVATDWLRFMGRLQLQPAKSGAGTDLINEFARHTQRERGLSPITINGRCWHVRAFLTWLGEQHSGAEGASLQQVDAFLSMRGAQGWCRASIATVATALRSFYAHMTATGRCAEGFVAGIEGPPLFKLEALTVGPCWDDVQRLIASTDTDQPRDIRDRVILMLLAIYGLRRGEVVALTLDDIDWEHDILHVVRPKQRCKQDYPLTTEVGNAILRYVREVRPRCASRRLFLTLKAPLGPLAPNGLHHVVASRLEALGIRSPRKGPHALRHACATHLVAEGLSLKQIGDHFGHRSASATRTYAKVDLVGLRQVADFSLGGVL
ncbi:MAG: tyrosine-type recombinase/integrase [Burkholderiaceae bacterium]|nr:tyrosine-type recombinase/integrase [Burkholderiaceae bacterium]